MAEYVVELPELEVACDFFIESEYPYFEELREAFLILKLCGCRPMEIFEISRWTYVNDWNFTLQPQKNNLVRSVTLGVGCESFRTCVINQINPFLGRTYSQIQGLFYKLCPWRPIFSGYREITLYVYRYFFVKSLIADGLSYAQVAELMGHRTETPVYLYANAVLTSTYEIPVGPVDPIPYGHIDLIMSPTFFNGTSDFITIDSPLYSSLFTLFCDCLPLSTSIKYILGANYYLSSGLSIQLYARKRSTTMYFQISLYSSFTGLMHSFAYSFAFQSNYKFIFFVDYSEVGSLGGPYKKIKLSYLLPDGNTLQSVADNKLIPSIEVLNSQIGCRVNASNVKSDFYYGNIFKLIAWQRILTPTEANIVFNL